MPSASPAPTTTENHAGFTELAATAIANAEAQAALSASRARIVATADATRRRIERNSPHDMRPNLLTLPRPYKARLSLNTQKAAT